MVCKDIHCFHQMYLTPFLCYVIAISFTIKMSINDKATKYLVTKHD